MHKGKATRRSGRQRAVALRNNSSPCNIPDPHGFTLSLQEQNDDPLSIRKPKDQKESEEEANWKVQKAWEVAVAPLQKLLMLMFVMWMAGRTVHVFSICTTFSSIFQFINALCNVGKVFQPYEGNKVNLLRPKLVYIALNMVGLGLGIWRLNMMGLFPAHMFDWVSSLGV